MKRALLAAAVSVAALLAPGLAPSASATTVSGACTTNAGVTVVVNFGALGGGVQVHCDKSATSSTTGLSALSSGFTPTGTQHDGPGFVCRINGKPASDPCINTPPATAYWSYWWASNGGSWTYSTKGAANRTVVVGGFEGWSFHSGSGANTPPTSGSPTHSVPVPQPQPTLSLGPAEHTTTTSSSHSSSSSSTSKKPSATKTTATPTTSTSGPTASDTSTGAAPIATSTSGDSAGGALPDQSTDDGSSPWPLIGGGAGIVLILAGAGVVVLRRRGTGGF